MKIIFDFKSIGLCSLIFLIIQVKPGQKPFMCLDELHDICSQSGFFDENFVERDANLVIEKYLQNIRLLIFL